MADEFEDAGVSTPKAPRELRQRLKNGEITEEEFERERLAIKTGAAKARLSLGAGAPESAPDSPSSPTRTLSRQFSELMDPEVCSACGVYPSRGGDENYVIPAEIGPCARGGGRGAVGRFQRTRGSPGMRRGQVKNLLSKVKLGKEKEVKEILSRDPSILKDAFDVQGNTMLHLAALNGHKRIVKEVLRNADHFNPYAINKKGLSAVDLARAWNYPELADYIRDKLPGIPEAKAEAPGAEAPEAIEVIPLARPSSSPVFGCGGHV